MTARSSNKACKRYTPIYVRIRFTTRRRSEIQLACANEIPAHHLKYYVYRGMCRPVPPELIHFHDNTSVEVNNVYTVYTNGTLKFQNVKLFSGGYFKIHFKIIYVMYVFYVYCISIYNKIIIICGKHHSSSKVCKIYTYVKIFYKLQ